MRRIPPLNSIRAFEAVAKRLSFKHAAEDLFVTQSAVSQQIKLLEEHFGFSLFLRNTKGLTLTEEGEKILPAIVQAFEIILDAVSEVSKTTREISISTSTSFAMSWMMPRFHQFEAEHPKITVQMSAGSQENNIPKYYDLEILYSTTPLEREGAEPLLEEWMIPVCSPKYLNSGIFDIHDLPKQRLLLNSPTASDWKTWAKLMHIDSADFAAAINSAMKLPTDFAAIEMAVAGYGIALTNAHYMSDKLNNKLLVPATDAQPVLLGAHYLSRKKNLSKHASELLIEWFQTTAKQSAEEIRSAFGTLGLPLKESNL
ncbi:MAG: LysR substrate-binding domain-containing protein [Pseudomonadales bacterium]|nr:LysR substrate-binding domain-containing protein [Pseudomonadales bacterium]NRA18363.1 LysR family transcriptional regulator [Oceanospirillaceae bacterium]